MKLNLGCGSDYRKGWVNCDCSRAVKADHYFDIRHGLPFEDETVTDIYISGVLAQIGPNEEFVFVMNELHRVLQCNATMTAIVPDATNSIAFRDPWDCRTFTQDTWRYVVDGERFYKMYGQIYGFRPWKISSIRTNQAGIMRVILAKVCAQVDR